MAAQNALDVRMATDDGLERVLDTQAESVHVLDAGVEGRVMHQHDRGRLRIARELAFKPFQALRAQETASLTGHHGVERDETQRADLCRVLEESPGVAKIRVLRES